MYCESFNKLVDMIIKDHPDFQNDSNKKQAKVSHQLLLFLHYLGKSGSGASNPHLRNVFHVGRGTAHRFKHRCITAIRSLRDDAIKWPDHVERKQIARRIRKNMIG
jgi:hypothetical protein